MPSLTRRGAAVLPTPPSALTLLRDAYFAVLRDATTPDGSLTLPADPTSVQRRATDKSPVYDGVRLASRGTDGTLQLVEGAVPPV